MRRFTLIAVLVILILYLGRSTMAQPQANTLSDDSSRLVVFEAFMRPT